MWPVNEYKQRYENRIACGTTETKHGMRRKMCLIYTDQVYVGNNTSVHPVFVSTLFLSFGMGYFRRMFSFITGEKAKITLCIFLKLCVYVTGKMNQC